MCLSTCFCLSVLLSHLLLDMTPRTKEETSAFISFRESFLRQAHGGIGNAISQDTQREVSDTAAREVKSTSAVFMSRCVLSLTLLLSRLSLPRAPQLKQELEMHISFLTSLRAIQEATRHTLDLGYTERDGQMVLSRG